MTLVSKNIDGLMCDCLSPGCSYCDSDGSITKHRNEILKQTLMKKYVVIFLFTPDFEDVWLIRKLKPVWQKGCLNGIGGKIEEGEQPYHAALRELEEEAGIPQDQIALTEVGVMGGTNNDGYPFEVVVFTGSTNLKLVSQEEEQIDLYDIGELKLFMHIENVPALIELCKYHQTGDSNFKRFKMEY